MVPILRSLLYNWGQDDDFVRNECLEIALHNFWDIFQVKYRILFVDFKGKNKNNDDGDGVLGHIFSQSRMEEGVCVSKVCKCYL